MTNEQKEGIIIFAFACVILIITFLATEWQGGISTSFLSFQGFTIEDCDNIENPNYSVPDGKGGFTTECYHTHQVGDFKIKLSFILAFTTPIIVYGLLRSFGIVRRIFKFEQKISRIIPTKKPEATP